MSDTLDWFLHSRCPSMIFALLEVISHVHRPILPQTVPVCFTFMFSLACPRFWPQNDTKDVSWTPDIPTTLLLMGVDPTSLDFWLAIYVLWIPNLLLLGLSPARRYRSFATTSNNFHGLIYILPLALVSDYFLTTLSRTSQAALHTLDPLATCCFGIFQKVFAAHPSDNTNRFPLKYSFLLPSTLIHIKLTVDSSNNHYYFQLISTTLCCFDSSRYVYFFSRSPLSHGTQSPSTSVSFTARPQSQVCAPYQLITTAFALTVCRYLPPLNTTASLINPLPASILPSPHQTLNLHLPNSTNHHFHKPTATMLCCPGIFLSTVSPERTATFPITISLPFPISPILLPNKSSFANSLPV